MRGLSRLSPRFGLVEPRIRATSYWSEAGFQAHETAHLHRRDFADGRWASHGEIASPAEFVEVAESKPVLPSASIDASGAPRDRAMSPRSRQAPEKPDRTQPSSRAVPAPRSGRQ
jgi:hypothetical protein